MARSSSYEVPGAKEAMNKFKQEVANEVGINLKQGYNGDLTSKQAGTIGDFVFSANNTAPFLASETSVPSVRVPSGNIHKAFSFLRRESVFLTAWISFFSLFTGYIPIALQNDPANLFLTNNSTPSSPV